MPGKLGGFRGGTGFLANGLKRYFRTVYSYDISKDAGEYGRKNFKGINFITKAITEADEFAEGPFDVILAYEFYPFTRTSEWEYQKKYIDMCLNNLNRDGILFIGLPDCRKCENLLRNKDNMLECYRSNQIEVRIAPKVKAYVVLKNWMMAYIASLLISRFVDTHYCIMLKHI